MRVLEAGFGGGGMRVFETSCGGSGMVREGGAGAESRGKGEEEEEGEAGFSGGFMAGLAIVFRGASSISVESAERLPFVWVSSRLNWGMIVAPADIEGTFRVGGSSSCACSSFRRLLWSSGGEGNSMRFGDSSLANFVNSSHGGSGGFLRSSLLKKNRQVAGGIL